MPADNVTIHAFGENGELSRGAELGLTSWESLRDTGWRDIGPDNGWAGGLYVRRVGLQCYAWIDALDAGASTSATFLNAWPDGMLVNRPYSAMMRGVLHTAAMTLRRTSDFTVANWSVGDVLYGNLWWVTNDPWPDPLPGVAAV